MDLESRRSVIKPSALLALILSWLFAVGVGPVTLSSKATPENSTVGSVGLAVAVAQTPPAAEPLPSLQVHPLPPSLAQWTAPAGPPMGDYFEAVQPTELGYLVWSQFPVQVYIQPAATDVRTQAWVAAVRQAVTEWTDYLPLSLTDDSETAGIKILRTAPAIQRLRQTPESPLGLPRIQTAETRYQFLRQHSQGSIQLVQQFTVQLSPNQTADYMLAAARHELGHALGIWGHSPLQTDALYFSQVRRPAAISARDISTLKRIYQQPTRLGWAMPVQTLTQAQTQIQTRRTASADYFPRSTGLQ